MNGRYHHSVLSDPEATTSGLPEFTMSSDDHPPRHNQPLSFVELMALNRMHCGDGTQSSSVEAEKVEYFQSIAPPFAPFSGHAAFGGHVYAQSAFAASQTVNKGFILHSVTGFFLRPGQLDVPFVYAVRHVRDGRNFCLRGVEAKQRDKLCFSCLCSFTRPDFPQLNNTPSHQPPFSDLERRYGSLLRGKRPEDHPLSPGIDSPSYIQNVKAGKYQELDFPGIEVRKVDMTQYNQTDEVKKNPHLYRQLQFYRFRGSPDGGTVEPQQKGKNDDDDGENENLFACAHLYASDKNSLFIIPYALCRPDGWTTLVSLSLTVIFHQHGDKLRMIDRDSGERKWFLEEFRTSRSGENRALHETRLWTADGILLATAVQDGLVRFDEADGSKL